MARLVYLYVSNGNGHRPWSPEAVSMDPFAGKQLKTEGFYYLFNKFLEEKIVDEVLWVVESSRSPGKGIDGKIEVLVVPHIDELAQFMRDDDILWARGGWRGWFTFLERWRALDRWLLFYRAASNRGAWPFWDVVFDDLRPTPAKDPLGRFYYPFCKPTVPTLFYPLDYKTRSFDVCLGASHVHDKKGQWYLVNVVAAYNRLYKTSLKCILPGSFKNGIHTCEIPAIVGQEKLDITFPGMLERVHMNAIYNDTTLFLHGGGAGQNDRGPLEAMSAGCPVMFTRPEIHSPWMTRTQRNFVMVGDDPEAAAHSLRHALNMAHNNDWRTEIKHIYEQNNGIPVIMDQFKRIFDVIKSSKTANRNLLYEAFL